MIFCTWSLLSARASWSSRASILSAIFKRKPARTWMMLVYKNNPFCTNHLRCKSRPRRKGPRGGIYCSFHILFLHWWSSQICQTLLLALVLVELQNTCKKKLNRKMRERPNICYIFGKLGVQGCQIWHSHVSIPFNSAAAHSTRPQKKLFTSLFQPKSY